MKRGDDLAEAVPAVPAPDGSAEPTLTEKKRILVKYNGVMQPFLWRRGASPDVLMSRLARSLEPTADPRALVLIDSDNEECDLCDSLENNAVVDARFLEIRLATLPMSVSPAVIAEVVGVSKPITNRNRDQTKKRKRHGDVSMSDPQREGYLILRKLVRKAVKACKYINGTGHFGVYPHMHHHKAYSFWKDSPHSDDVYHLQQSEAIKIQSMPEILTVLSQFNFGKETVFTVLDTHFRSNRGLCKPPNDATPPSVDPVEALETDEEAQRAAQAIRKAYLSEGSIRTMDSLFYGSVASGMWQDLDAVTEEHEL